MSARAPHRRMTDAVRQARLIQLLPRGPGLSAMVVGGGAGYSAAILARLVDSVVLVEEDEHLATTAGETMRGLGVDNVRIVRGALVDGCQEHAPYDGILVDGAVEVVPDRLLAQLSSRGALAVIKRDERFSRAMLYERVGDGASHWPKFEAWATLLPGFQRAREFVF